MLNFALLQTNIKFCDAEYNFKNVKNLFKEAMKYKSKITFEYSGNTANAKSVLSVLGACIKSGDEITLVCDGEDEHEALRELVAYVESGLGE